MDEVENKGVAQVDAEHQQAQTEAAPPSIGSVSDEGSKPAQVAASNPEESGTGLVKHLRKSFRESSKRAEEAERRAQASEDLLRKILESQGKPAQSGQEEDILGQLQSQEYVEGKKVASALKRQQEDFDKKIEDLKRVQAVSKSQEVEANLLKQYPDLEKVVNPENLEILKQTNPKLHARIANLYKVDSAQAVEMAYETLTKEGIVEKEENETIPSQKTEVERKLNAGAQQKKVDDSRPMAQVMSYAEKIKQARELDAEMSLHAAKVGGAY